MAYKLAIADVVGIKVEGNTKDAAGADKAFKFTLICDRLKQEELRDVVADKDETTNQFFEKHAKDWQGQTLVLDDEGRPAPFSVEALAVLFTIGGMSSLCWQNYIQQVVAVAKN